MFTVDEVRRMPMMEYYAKQKICYGCGYTCESIGELNAEGLTIRYCHKCLANKGGENYIPELWCVTCFERWEKEQEK